MAKFNLRSSGTDTTYLDYKGTTLTYADLDSNFKGLGNGQNALFVASVLANGDITAYSDERLKTNIKTIDNALGKVNGMRGVTFEREGKPSLGVVAQEVEKVVPEVVNTEEDEMGTKSVAYGNLTGLLIQAVKELSDKVNNLEKQLEDLNGAP